MYDIIVLLGFASYLCNDYNVIRILWYTPVKPYFKGLYGGACIVLWYVDYGVIQKGYGNCEHKANPK